MTIKEIYEQTIVLIETRGWFGEGGTTDPNAVCLVYAMQLISRAIEIADCLNLYIEAYSKLKSLIPESGYGAQGSLIRWNDTPGRTKEEVIELLRKGIALCE